MPRHVTAAITNSPISDPPSFSAGRLDFLYLADDVQELYKLGIAPSTSKTYTAAIKKFQSFCTTFNIQNPFPLSQDTLCNFAAFLNRQNIKQSTLKVYLAALRYQQVGMGLPAPNHAAMPKLKTIGNGMQRMQRQNGCKRNRLPITPAILRNIKEQWADRATEYDIVMFWAAACMAFFGFFRLGEILIPPGEAYMIQICLKQSKTDQFGKGAMVYIGRTDTDLCPIAAILAFMALRASSPGPFFQQLDKTPLRKDKFVEEIRTALTAAGITASDYAGHSFRIGAATTAAQCGVPETTIQALGRWTSDAYRTYIRLPQEYLANMAHTLCRPTDQQTEGNNLPHSNS